MFVEVVCISRDHLLLLYYFLSTKYVHSENMSCCIFPQGIGTSLGILANILVSMNDEDFNAFRAKPDIDLVGPTVAICCELWHRTNYF